MVVLAAWCGPATAKTQVVSWPTYYRTGPDRHYSVLNELDRGVTLEVLACDGGWCKVQSETSTGYVEQSALSDPSAFTPEPTTQAASDGCFDSHETGYGKGENWHYCPR